jgi:hypothetical protein
MAQVPESDKQESLTVQTQLTIANRAPNSKDQGYMWANDKGSTVDFYIRSKKTGTWKGPTTLS